MVHTAKYRMLSAGAKLFWLWVLSEVARSSSRTALVHPLDISRNIHVKPGNVLRALNELVAIEWIQIVKTPMNRLEKKRKEEKRKRGALPTPSASAPAIIPVYCDHWKNRYGTNPPISGRIAGQLTQLTKDLGQERACALVQAYLQMPDPWFVTKRHDVSTLVTNLNAVAQFLDTGKMVTKAHVKEISDMVDENLGPTPKGIEQILAEKARKEIRS